MSTNYMWSIDTFYRALKCKFLVTVEVKRKRKDVKPVVRLLVAMVSSLPTLPVVSAVDNYSLIIMCNLEVFLFLPKKSNTMDI